MDLIRAVGEPKRFSRGDAGECCAAVLPAVAVVVAVVVEEEEEEEEGFALGVEAVALVAVGAWVGRASGTKLGKFARDEDEEVAGCC